MIDCHRHFMFGKADEAAMLREMERDQVERAVLFGYQGMRLLPGPHAQDAFILELANRHPDKIIPFFCDVDFFAPDALDYIRQACKCFSGMGEILLGHSPMHRAAFDGRRMDDAPALAAFQEVGRYGLPVLFHADPPFEAQAESMLVQCPNTRFIWAHIGYDFLGEYGGSPRAAVWAESKLDQFPNLYFDLSHWKISPIYLLESGWQSLLERKSERFVLGVDMSESYEAEGLWIPPLRAVTVGLSGNAKRRIEGDNLLGLLAG